MSSKEIKVDIANGKYTVIIPAGGGLHALRYNEPWRSCVGDGLIFNLAYELHETRTKVKELQDEIENAAIEQEESI